MDEPIGKGRDVDGRGWLSKLLAMLCAAPALSSSAILATPRDYVAAKQSVLRHSTHASAAWPPLVSADAGGAARAAIRAGF